MINNTLNNNPLPVYWEGKNIKDWIHVKDNYEIVLQMLKNGELGEVYNISGDSEIWNIDLVRKILKILDKSESLVTFVKDRSGYDLRYWTAWLVRKWELFRLCIQIKLMKSIRIFNNLLILNTNQI